MSNELPAAMLEANILAVMARLGTLNESFHQACQALRRFYEAWRALPLEVRRAVQRQGGIPEHELDTE